MIAYYYVEGFLWYQCGWRVESLSSTKWWKQIFSCAQI